MSNPHQTRSAHIRAEYTMQTDPGFLKGEPMGKTENPTTYIEIQLRRQREEMKRDPEQDKSTHSRAVVKSTFVESKTSPSPKRFESESSPSPKRFESESSPSP